MVRARYSSVTGCAVRTVLPGWTITAMMLSVPAGPSSKGTFTMVGEGRRTVVSTHAYSL
jgi:hypothetical protein